MDRGIHYNKLEKALYEKKDVQVIFMYATGKRIHQEMKDKGLERDGIFDVENLDEAVELAKRLLVHIHMYFYLLHQLLMTILRILKLVVITLESWY